MGEEEKEASASQLTVTTQTARDAKDTHATAPAPALHTLPPAPITPPYVRPTVPSRARPQAGPVCGLRVRQGIDGVAAAKPSPSPCPRRGIPPSYQLQLTTLPYAILGRASDGARNGEGNSVARYGPARPGRHRSGCSPWRSRIPPASSAQPPAGLALCAPGVASVSRGASAPASSQQSKARSEWTRDKAALFAVHRRSGGLADFVVGCRTHGALRQRRQHAQHTHVPSFGASDCEALRSLIVKCVRGRVCLRNKDG